MDRYRLVQSNQINYYTKRTAMMKIAVLFVYENILCLKCDYFLVPVSFFAVAAVLLYALFRPVTISLVMS